MPSTTWTPLTQPASASTVTSTTTATLSGTSFVRDTFSGAAQDTPISSRAGELGATWTQHSAATSVVVISSAGRARDNGSTPNGSFYYASGLPASADYRVIADITKLSAAPTAVFDILARVSPTVDTRYGTRYATVGTPGWTLYKVVSGAGAALGAQFNDTIPNDTTRQVVLQVLGSSIQVFVDGTSRISVSDSAITLAGRVGLGGANISAAGADTTGLALDNFGAVALDSVSTTTTVTVTLTPIPAWTAASAASTGWTASSGASTTWSTLT